MRGRGNKKFLGMFGVLVASGVVLVGVFLMRDGELGTVDKEKIIVKNIDGELSVYRSGLVEYRTDEDTFIDNWSREKIEAFFSYYEENYEGARLAGDGDGETVAVGGVTYGGKGDELTRVVIDDVTNDGGDDGDDGSGGDISDYFGTTPPATQAGGQVPTPTPGGGIPSDCLFWRLSYCVKYKPTPTPTPTPVGGDIYVIQAADCDEWNETQTTNTVINNTVCVPLE